MKKLYTLIFIGLATFDLQAQVINFPDPVFKSLLLASNANGGVVYDTFGFMQLDANNDGEIEISETSSVFRVSFSNSDVTSLQGIEYFTNLKELYCYNSPQLTSLDVSGMQLWTLDCKNNNLSSLTLCPGIMMLNCDYNQLTSLTLYDGLIDFNCSHNQLQTLDLQNSDFSILDVSHNQLTSIDVSGVTGIYEGYFNDNVLQNLEFPNMGFPSNHILDISNNSFTTFSLTTLVDVFKCQNTLVESIDFPLGMSTSNSGGYVIANNPNLQFINLRNGSYDFASWDEVFSFDLSLTNNPSLQLICVDDFSQNGVSELQYLQDELGLQSTAQITPYCSLEPVGNFNTLMGNIRFDSDNDGCDSTDFPGQNIPIALTTVSYPIGTAYAQSAGNYEAFFYGNAIVTPQVDNAYFTISPTSFTTTFNGSVNTQTVDFCIIPNGTHSDLEVTVASINAARPGFDATYKITCKNKGTTTQSGSINLIFDDALLDLVSSNPATSSQSTNNLNWNFTNLAPFESREITLTLNLNSPQETPAVNNGDVLNYTASVTGLTDETPNDNTAILHQTVVGSFDPNDKIVAEGASITPEQLGDFLHYTIRFQNTGTFAAENVVVKDLLENNFDLTSLQIISASHAFRSTLTFGNQLEFFFENINLPPSSTDEPGSHGYVTFKIKPKNTVVLGNILQNSASIYFDFNFPIVTEPVTTLVSLLGVEDYLSRNTFSIYPNPVNGILNIESNDEIRSVEISNNLGQSISKSSETNQVDVSNLASGIYFIKVSSDKGKSVQKFIKL